MYQYVIPLLGIFFEYSFFPLILFPMSFGFLFAIFYLIQYIINLR